MQPSRLIILSALLISVLLRAQDQEGKRKGPGPEDLPTSSLISKPGPSFVVSQTEIQKQTKVIIYGDRRFTDPSNTKVTNPKVRCQHQDGIRMLFRDLLHELQRVQDRDRNMAERPPPCLSRARQS
jgi:hypothetical protein